jgi:riboflavin kinase
MDLLEGDKDLKTGIYYGLSSVDSSLVPGIRHCVISIGWNPFFKNEKKTIEAHVMSSGLDDFYDAKIRICLLGYLRDECSFESLDDLISCIRSDISMAADRIVGHVFYQQFALADVDESSGLANWRVDE